MNEKQKKRISQFDYNADDQGNILQTNRQNQLVCDCCGWIERQPFDDGDECVCGGFFRSYEGEIREAKTQYGDYLR